VATGYWLGVRSPIPGDGKRVFSPQRLDWLWASPGLSSGYRSPFARE
jgi:hypothetical protein